MPTLNTRASARVLPLLLALAVIAPSLLRAADAATRPSAPSINFAGHWDTTFGPMVLTQDSNVIQGTYGAGRATIRGKLDGGRFVFTYTEPNAAGEGWFELAADGDSFSGQWREKGNATWQGWRGARRDAPPKLDTFTGLWRTSYGKMRLRQDGGKVEGIYDFGGGSKVTGTVEGRTLTFTYDQPDGEKGSGTFELSADAASFKGTWKGSRGGANQGGAWSATRILPQPGRTWLVILEAPWERDLEQEEYSYGAMLRAFFTRAPQVRVRHRFINDEADLRKWCAETIYLAEPVVLYISSHGTKEGIACGGKQIGADVLTDCVRHAGNLKLLHFGACLVGGGDIPRQIHAALESGPRFPISGFDRSVDWAGSAIVDFTYLDLVLVRNLPPAEAWRQTRQMLSFARDRGNADDAIPTTGSVYIPAPRADKNSGK